MSQLNNAHRIELRALLAAVAVAVATSVHHAYGAVIYHTPWRYHAIGVAAITVALMLAGLRVSRTRPGTLIGRVGWWTFWGLNAAIFVLVIGAFEGVYNHALKNVLYFGGAAPLVMRTLFPPPTYELPNDWLFELTGVLQIVPSGMAAYYLGRLLSDRPRRGSLAGGRSPVRTRLITSAQSVVRVTGPVQIVLGLGFWIGRGWSLRPLHMVTGMVFDLALLSLVLFAVSGGLRPAAAVAGIALVIVLPLFGVVHARLLPGPLHWVVRSAHLLLGVAAMVAANRLARFARANSPVTQSARGFANRKLERYI